jgi:hypothetical protein
MTLVLIYERQRFEPQNVFVALDSALQRGGGPK